MLKFDLTTAEGLSAFAKTFKHQCINSNIDIRTTKDSKVLHRVAETLGFSNWSELKRYMDEPQKAPSPTPPPFVLADVVDVDSPELISEAIYGVAVESSRVRFVLGSEVYIDFFRALSDISSIELVKTKFGHAPQRVVLEGEEFDRAKQLFEAPLNDALNINDRW